MSIYTRLCRQFYVFRFPSHPYLSGDTVRSFIKCRVEGKHPRYKRNWSPVIFCEGDHVVTLLKQKSLVESPPFVLVTGNGDQNIKEDILPLLPDNLLHWYGQNILFKHPKLTPLPIGLENRYYGNSGSVNHINFLRGVGIKKQVGIFYSFNVATNRVAREPALQAASVCNLCTGPTDRIPAREFQALLANHMFTLSPPGNGFDCHRTWEAMYLRTVPIVKKSYWSDYFISLGLPMLAMDSWKELERLSESYLIDFYASCKEKFENPALFSSYWKSRIAEDSKKAEGAHF